MQVTKRNGTKEEVKLEKISKRITRHTKDLKNIDTILVAQKVVEGLYDGVTTSELDSLATETAYSMSVKHPEYDKLSLRLAVSTLHKDTPSTFLESIERLYNVKDTAGKKKPLIADNVYKFVKKNAHIIDAAIVHDRDYLFDYFGFKTLERSYLLREKNVIVERPQYLWMRVACGIHVGDIDAALQTYELLSNLRATHATPTLFNAGTPKNQLSSCFLLAINDDSIEGIYDTIKECALISQSSGGIGFWCHNVRSNGSPIYGSGGTSRGIIPMLKNFCETARYVDQGGSRRKGSFACYLEPWHADVEDFLELRKNNGKEEMRARDLNIALWTPDLFFKQVEADGDWHLMDPNVSKDLHQVFDETEEGGSFTDLYNKYISEGKFVKKIKARDLWQQIISAQIEGGEPYILAKDACNRKSNQKNLGTIKSSNLCCEIIEYSSPEQIAVCNLASISLPANIEGKKGKRTYNFAKLEETVKILTENLNKIIDSEYYPLEKAKKSNLAHRPIGLGIQGLADTFSLLRYSWDSQEAKDLNVKIAETIYYATLSASCDLAKKYGKYDSFDGSPLSEGLLQFDMWGVTPSDRYDWEELRTRIKKYGVRNSLNVAPMPTASTSQILGNTEAFEVITSNIYKRQTLSGEFIQVNKYLVEDLMELGLWTENIRQKIIAADGSIQDVTEIPTDLKNLYKTVWEISQRITIDMAADRGPYICQSQSMNLYFKDPNMAKISSALMHAWKRGLKTIVYYTRTKAAKEGAKFTVEVNEEPVVDANSLEGIACSIDNPESCVACGS